MSGLKLWVVFCILQASSVQHALGQEPKPIMTLNGSYTYTTIIRSGCNNGLMNDVDLFTVKGIVNKNNSSREAYIDTNLYLQAVKDPSTNAWASQCRPDLTVCSPNLTTDCYCENFTNGDYDIVMTIMAKSLYLGGKLMLSWNDARSPYNPPVTSDIVNYYSGPIWDQTQMYVTVKIGSFDEVIDEDVILDKYSNFSLNYSTEITNLTFCVYNINASKSIKTKEFRDVVENDEKCAILDLRNLGDGSEELTMSFNEKGGCERQRSYVLNLEPSTTSEPKKQVTEPWIIVVSCLGGFIFVIIVITFIICCVRRKKKKREPSCQPSTILSSKDQLEGYDNQHEHNGRSVSMSSAGYQHNRKSSPPTTLESTPGAHQQQQYQNDVYTMPRNLAPYQYNVKQTPSSKPGEHHHHYHHRDEYDKITTPVKPASMTSL